ncbi:hypothetical protein INS49_014218 [Diaporthe citri]|uniref:uncharacterized protein n=1 Tax=Diaporthe citri TaxID=83186 RepID=UPI001C80012B|nr:uncharacterized protein INS49_014218 [Diaporthe citri]KAG6358334.1 hypothetical protein INS49_014218 [Diaporthe citri]
MEQNNNDGPVATCNTSDVVSSEASNVITLNQPDDTAGGSNEELINVYEEPDTTTITKLDARKSQTEKKYNLDIHCDKDLERLSISLHEEVDDDQRIIAEAATREQDKTHARYKLHFFKKVGSLFIPIECWTKIIPEDDPGYLCDMCRHLDFKVLFTKRGIPGNNTPYLPAQLEIDGMWRIMQDDNNCAVCGLLRRKINESGSLSQISDGDIAGGRFNINVLDNGPEYALSLEIDIRVSSKTVARFVLQRLEEQPEQPLAGRFVQQDRADMDGLRQWLHICESNHPSSGKGLELDMASFRVIDTKELCIVEVETPCRYACLSYVWGEGSQTQYNTTTKDSLEAANRLQVVELPQTMRDAIKVTQEVGLRYLWVDALCILQDDSEDKARLIPKMGPIYGNATLTIIASANTNPQDGLPGMGNVHRHVAQDTIRIQGITVAVALHDPRQPIHDIDDSVWNSRAWAFQEQALSERRIYFTHSQLIFKCAHSDVMLEEAVPVPEMAFRHPFIDDHASADVMHLVWTDPSLSQFTRKGIFIRHKEAVILSSEESDTEKSMSQEEKDKATPMFKHAVDAPRDFLSSLGDTDDTPWDSYRRAVEDYAKRNLTWEVDVLDAFAGVEHIVRRGINTKFWFGIPSFAFEQALLWQAREPLKRRSRPRLPSWSWAAWRGQVSYQGRGWKNCVVYDPMPVARWYVLVSPQTLIENFKAEEERTEEEVRAYTERVTSCQHLHELNFHALRHLGNEGKDGWVVEHNEVYNRHIYSHDAYPGVKFTYPVDLPGETIRDRPEAGPNGIIFFKAHVVPVVPYDMEEHSFKMKVEDRFLQIGFNDESRSSDSRPAWQRIVYHQGYRAGFITLNNKDYVDFCEADFCEFRLAAISRGSLPRLLPSIKGKDWYWCNEPREMQSELLREEWTSNRSFVRAPDEDVEPSTRPQRENGDPHWDTGRLGGVGICDVYDVLLLMTMDGISWRLGVGKVNTHAFLAAQPEEMLVKLA